MRIGILSDTHGLLRASALDAMRGADAIVHGGDIGGPDILEQLAVIAPVHAVRGNNDTAAWAASLPAQLDLCFDGVLLRVVHDVKTLQGNARADGVQVLVSGHSHRPGVAWRDGMLHVNPGSAGPRRFRLPICIARLQLGAEGVEAVLQELAPD